MMRNRRMSRLATVLSVSLFLSTIAEAQYIGLEPERLVSLLPLDDTSKAASGLERAYAQAAAGNWELAEAAFRSAGPQTNSDARLGLVVALSQLGRNDEALELTRDHHDFQKLGYARVLLKLRADPKVSFDDLRAELLDLASLDEDGFDLWLALNPSDKELESYAHAIASRSGLVAYWERAEIRLRLEQPQAALDDLRGVADSGESGWHRNLIDLTRARALFSMGSDEEGERIYRSILERLDPPTSDRLFRDISSIASSSEWEDYPELWDNDERKDFFRQFWARRDPVPTGSDNPRIGEHYRRLARALDEYPLQSTGRGYFVDKEVFLSLSPQLPYYDSLEFFRFAQRGRYWLDHRGLLFLRLGAPDRKLSGYHYGGTDGSESWVTTKLSSEPLAFHFVRRPKVGEWTVALNLGVAATRPSAADEPEEVRLSRTRAFDSLYASRQMLVPLYRHMQNFPSYKALLLEESEQMAWSVQAVMAQESTDFYNSENVLPLSASVSSYYEQGQPAIDVDFASDLTAVDPQCLSPDFELEVVVLAYDSEWNVARRYQQGFSLAGLPAKGPKVLVGSVQVHDLDPADYRMVVEVHQPDTDRYGVVRGRHDVTSLPAGDLGLSDLFLQTEAGNGSKHDRKKSSPSTTADENVQWLPVPTRVIKKSKPSRIYFELYNPDADGDGVARYEIEERVETLEKHQSVWSNLGTLGAHMASAFFPLYTLAVQTASGLMDSEHSGKEDLVTRRVVEKPAKDSMLETVETDLSKLDKGVHAVHITVHDLDTGETTSQSLTLRVD